MDSLGSRIKFAAEKIGGLEELGMATGIKRTTIFSYASGRTEPKISGLVSISNATGVPIEWLVKGTGPEQLKTEVQVREVDVQEIRKIVWNIAAVYWEKLPRRTKPNAVADQFVDTLDYLLSQEGVQDEATSQVIQFGAEQLKRASSQGD